MLLLDAIIPGNRAAPVVAQLTDLSIPTTDDLGSNPSIGHFIKHVAIA